MQVLASEVDLVARDVDILTGQGLDPDPMQLEAKLAVGPEVVRTPAMERQDLSSPELAPARSAQL